jgi:hypothetical protein
MIHTALKLVTEYHRTNYSVLIRVEDARQVRFKTDAVKMKGEDGKWQYIRSETLEGEIRPRNPATGKPRAKQIKPPQPAMPRASRSQPAARSKRTDPRANPEKVTIKSDAELFALGWRYVEEKRGWQTVRVLRAPGKLAV